MRATPNNPYTHSRTESEFADPTVNGVQDYDAHAVPSGDAPYNDEFGWAPSLRLGPVSLPDTTRLGTEPRRARVPDDGTIPAQFFLPIDANKAMRHSAEYQDADGFEENTDYPGYPAPQAGAHRFARDPKETPPEPTRATSRLSPRTYLFTRPFMTGLPKMGQRDLNGIHFSMADHRREYDVTGMTPVQTRRNTYRIDPIPWDTGLVDMPPANATNVTDLRETPVTVEVGYSSRNWRLS